MGLPKALWMKTRSQHLGIRAHGLASSAAPPAHPLRASHPGLAGRERCGARGATRRNSSGQGGQQCTAVPAECGRRRAEGQLAEEAHTRPPEHWTLPPSSKPSPVLVSLPGRAPLTFPCGLIAVTPAGRSLHLRDQIKSSSSTVSRALV